MRRVWEATRTIRCQRWMPRGGHDRTGQARRRMKRPPDCRGVARPRVGARGASAWIASTGATATTRLLRQPRRIRRRGLAQPHRGHPERTSRRGHRPDAGRIYWANRGNDTISYANLDGSGGGGQLQHRRGDQRQAPRPGGRSWGRRIYWANDDQHRGGVRQSRRLGGGLLGFTGATPGEPYGLALDHVAGRISGPTGSPTRSPAPSSTDRAAEANSTSPGAVGQAPRRDHRPAAGKVYWANLSNTICYANADEPAAAAIGRPKGPRWPQSA